MQPTENGGETVIFQLVQEEPVQETPTKPAFTEQPAAELISTKSGAVMAPEIPLQSVIQEDNSLILTGKKKSRGKSLVLLAAIVVVLVALVIGVVKLLPSLMGGSSKYAYLSDDGELMYMKKLSSKIDAVEINDDADDVCFSSDGKYLYFDTCDSETYHRTLYRIETAKVGKKNAEPEKISSGVGPWELLDGGKIAYMRDDQLRFFDGKESTKLANDVDDFSIHEGYAYYTEIDDGDYNGDGYCDGLQTLYRVKLDAKGEKEKLLSNVDCIYGSIYNDPLVYGKQNENAENDSYDVYAAKPGEKGEKILSDVEDIYDVKVNGGKPSFYFTTQQSEHYNLYDFVSDSMASSDMTAEEPSTSDYEVYDAGYFGGWWQTDWDAYYAAEDKWNEVDNRNDIRNYLKNQEYDVVTYTLKRYEGGKETEIASGADSMTAQSAADGVFLYTKTDMTPHVVADVADLSYGEDLYDLISQEAVMYQNVGGKESKLQVDEDYSNYDLNILNGTEAIIGAYDANSGENMLLDYTVGNSELTYNGTVTDESISSVTFEDIGDGKEALYYFEDVDDNGEGGSFIRYLSGKKTTEVKDAYVVYALQDGKTFYSMSDPSSARGNGAEYTLSLVKDGKSEKVSDDVSSVTILGEKQVAYINDGDLYYWNGSKSERVATDVECFWSSDEVNTTAFWL
ncbi:hypothetical protein OBV_34380 [Oscillibacter valericigenes Sjm18-20]|nr:hypothetical protein OBV_34380 [Oscillibacter valericigenes Sjm18-20]